MWNEAVAESGSEETGSCLWKWLENLCKEIDDVRLNSDSYIQWPESQFSTVCHSDAFSIL